MWRSGLQNLCGLWILFWTQVPSIAQTTTYPPGLTQPTNVPPPPPVGTNAPVTAPSPTNSSAPAPAQTNSVAIDTNAAPGNTRIMLTNTSVAPSTASGLVELPHGEWTGSSNQFMSVTIKGVLPGVYNIRAVIAPGTNITIGGIALVDPDTDPDTTAASAPRERGHVHQATLLEVRSEVKIPAGLQAAQVRGISVSGPSGNTVLAGTR